MQIKNLFEQLPEKSAEESFDDLLSGRDFQVKRIVSTGQSTPAGEWYDQSTDEWVLLLSGGAKLTFESPAESVALRPGDYVCIPAHRRHRVEWTSPEEATVWLALYYQPT